MANQASSTKMVSKFKVGDIVRCTSSKDWAYARKGNVRTVKEVDNDCTFLDHNGFWHDVDHFEIDENSIIDRLLEKYS